MQTHDPSLHPTRCHVSELVQAVDDMSPGQVLNSPDPERLARKLELIMRDVDLNLALGAHMSQLIVPGLVSQHELSQAQADRIEAATRETIGAIAEEVLPPSLQIASPLPAALQARRNKISDFARW